MSTPDSIRALVEKLDRFPVARTSQEKEILSRQVESTDGEIDRLVYRLYGLTEDEVKIVEGG